MPDVDGDGIEDGAGYHEDEVLSVEMQSTSNPVHNQGAKGAKGGRASPNMNASKLAKASSRKKYLDGKSALEGTAANGFLDNIYVELTPETDLQMKARNEFRTCEKEAKKKIEGLWDTLQKIINDKKDKTPQAQKEEYEKETKERVFGVLARYFGDSLYETEETKDAHVVKNAAMTKDEFVQKFMGLRQKMVDSMNIAAPAEDAGDLQGECMGSAMFDFFFGQIEEGITKAGPHANNGWLIIELFVCLLPVANNDKRLDPKSDEYDFGASIATMTDHMLGPDRQIDIVMKDLTLTTPWNERVAQNVGSHFKDCFHCCSSEGSRDHIIVNQLTATCKSGDMILLLGPPTAGKSTLLKMLGTRFMKGQEVKANGTLKFNGNDMCDEVKRLTSLINPFEDVLLADLTCQETFEFAHENSTSINTVLTQNEIENHAFKLLQGEMKEQGDTTTDKGHLTDDQKQRLKELEEIVKENHETLNNTTIDMLLKVLEIPHVAHTIVGNAIKKGISGGQKRRVSIGEALMKKAPILLGDEVTNGLDAVTAFRVVQSIRKMCKFLHYTSILSVLQPSPDTYSLFDYIIMLTEEGNVAYAGPRLNEHGEDASLEYFQSIGLQKPPDAVMPQPDFLDIVCQGPESTEQFAAQYDNDLKLFMDGNLKEDNTGNQPFLCKSMKQRKKKYPSYPSNNGTGSIKDGTKHRPDNVADFKACWTSSGHFKQTEKEADDQLARWKDSSNENEKAKPFNPMYKDRFGTTFMENLKSLTARQWLLQKKDEDTWKGTIAQAILVGNMCGTMFWQLGDSGVDGQSKAGLFIFIVANLVFSTFEILPSMFAQRPTLYNQLKQGYVRVPAYVFCQILTAFPLDLFRAVVFGSIVYWQAGLSSDFGKFLYYILVCLLLCLMANQVTRVFCACSPAVGLAQSLAPLFGMVIGIGFSGYVLPRDEMPKYMVWIYYCSPFQYLYQGLMINEQAGQGMNEPYFQPSITSGDLQLKSFNYSTDEDMKWVFFVIGFIFWIAFIILNMMAYKFLRFDEHAKAGETQAEKAEEKAMVRETSPWFRGEPTKVSKARPKVLNDPKCDVPTIGKKVCMSFKDLSWEIDIPSKSGNGTQKLRILTNTFGFFRPGSATALMGSSGAGKSTLMDVLLGMKTTGRITGEIYVNKRPFERKYKGKKITGELEEDKLKDAIVQFPTELRRYVGYVEQFNIHYDTQTVEEAFYFSCKTRLNPIGADGKTPVQDEDRHEMVQYALEVLKLTHCKDLPISDLNSQEAKRTTMGVELVADPSILMLDEPTSGLDSVGALTVMRSIGEIKKTGVTVVVVIHQPSENLFDYFDSLLLLKRGGRVVYFGACPKREKPATPTTPATEAKHIQAFQFFRDMRGAPVWRNENPADYILKFCDGNFDVIFASGELCTQMKEYVAEHKYLEGTGIEISAHDDMPVLPEYPRMYALSDWDQVKTIYWRARSDYWRNPGYNFIRMVVALFSALFLGLMYLQLGDDLQQCGFRLTLPFMMIVFQIPYTLMAMTPVFNTRAVHFRERQSLCYRERSYFTITGFVEAPYILASINIFMWPVFVLSDLNQGGDRVFFYWLFLCSFQFFNVFYGQMVATLAPNGDVAQKIAPATLALYILSCGFMLQPDNIPNYWKWLYWFSPYHYALEALGANELYGRECGGYVNGVSGSERLLNAYDLDFDHRYRNLLIILLYALVCRIGSLLALKYVNWVER